MKASEIRELSAEEMTRKIDDLKEELFNLRFQHGIDQLDNTTMISKIKRDIARFYTIQKEVESKEA